MKNHELAHLQFLIFLLKHIHILSSTTLITITIAEIYGNHTTSNNLLIIINPTDIEHTK